MKKRYIIVGLGVALCASVVSASICRYCSGTKWRTIEETCPTCKGAGVVGKNVDMVKCGKCQGVTTRKMHPYKNGTLEYGSGKIKKRVKCDMCVKRKIIKLSDDDLAALSAGGCVTNGGYIITK